MKLCRCLILLMLLPTWLFGQSGYLLIATYELKEPGRSWMCRNYAYFQEELIDVKAYESRRKEIYTQYKDNEVTVRLVAPDEAVMVFEYEKSISGWNCTKKVIAVRTGKDLASCQRQIDDDVRTWSNDYKTSPKSIFQRGPATESGKQVIKQNWDGIQIEYTYLTNAGAERFVVVRAKNTLVDKTAVIGQFLVVNSKQELAMKPINEYRLGPGQSMVIQLKPAADYSLGLQLVKPDKKTESFSIIEWAKKHIRAQVSKKGYIEDAKREKLPSIGVRG